MDDHEKTELEEMDVEMGSGKKTRRSSILKPQKPRNPLSTLDFSESNPDTTLARATRRVSFASSNFVKPFAADPEKNTIWDNTYEEEVNHTDSTKSSCDQTHGTKSSDILNMSSVYSTSQSYHNGKITIGTSSLVSESININTEKVQTMNIISNPGDSLVSLARTLRSKSLEQSTCEIVVNKNCFPKFAVNEVSDKENIKPQQSVFFPTSDNTEDACVTPKIGETMEITACIVDKENVNPIINDLSLVVPRQNSLSFKSVSKDFHEHFECTSDNKVESDMNFTKLDVKNDLDEFKSTMEFTCITDCNKVQANDESTSKTCTVGKKTVYFDDSMNDMEFTNMHRDVELQNKSIKSQERRKTIIFDQTGGTMDFTLVSTNDINIKESAEIEKIQVEDCVKKSSVLRDKTILFGAAESDMEFTTTLPAKIMSDSKIPTSTQFPVYSKTEETIRFDNSGEEMELTDVFTTEKIVVEDQKNSIKMKNNATITQMDDMEFTAVLPTKTIENKQIETEEEKNDAAESVSTFKDCQNKFQSDATQMELTDVFTSQKIVTEDQTYSTKVKNNATITQVDDMEFTAVLPTKSIKNKQIEIEEEKIKTKNDTVESVSIFKDYQTKFQSDATQMEVTDVFTSQKIVTENQKYSTKMKNNDTITQMDDMKFTAVLPTKTIKNKQIETEEEKIKTENDAAESVAAFKDCQIKFQNEPTQNESGFNQCDMSLTKNLRVTKNSISIGPDPVRYINPGVTVQDISTKLLLGIEKMGINANNSEMLINVTNNSSYVRKADKFSPKQNISNHESPKSDVLSVSKGVDMKRHITKSADDDEELIKKRKIQEMHRDETQTDLKSSLPLDTHKSIKTSSLIEGRDSLPVLKPGPIEVPLSDDLELTKLKLKTPKFAPIHDMSAGGLDRVSTPATSFHLNLSGLSPCVEDTQQLIQATFSRPETLGVLHTSNFPHSNNTSNFERTVQKSSSRTTCEGLDGPTYDDSMKLNGKTFVKEDIVFEPDTDLIKIAERNPPDDKSYFLEDITPLTLVPEDFDASNLEPTPNRNPSETEPAKGDSSSSARNSDAGNDTLRSNMVLSNIQKNLWPYEPVKFQKSSTLSRLKKEFDENCRLIKEICASQKFEVIDLEEMHKRNMEESLSSVNEAMTSAEEEVGTPLVPAFVAPRTLQERICEVAERYVENNKQAKKYWEFVKMEDDYCYFYTLFGTLPFKVHVHPELGIVYSVTTYTNLSDIVLTICEYQLKLFQQKLKQEHLLSVLGAKFDIFTLLDYVYMFMEETMNFHSEYLSLVKKYGRTHHFRMNPDYSITFEILNVKFVVCWIITVKMSLSGPSSIKKEDVTAVHKVGQIVIEENIRTIVENTSKGLNFFRKFIENVDEYVNRLQRRIKK